jgi:class 3 adenylate cyclase
VGRGLRRQARGLPRLEAPFSLTLAFHPPGGKRISEPFEPLRPEVLEFKQAAEQPAGRRGTAIMAVDVVGYSRLMGEDEAARTRASRHVSAGCA